MRRIAISVAATSVSVMLAGCGVLNATGSSDDASPTKGDDITVGLLLPEKANTRYEEFDHPIFKAKVESLTDNKGRVEYANADADAGKQSSQLQAMVDKKVDVIVLDAVDAHAIAPGVQKAKDAGIPVIAYDRLAEGPIDAYISFDNELVGEVQGRSLLESLGDDLSITDKIVMMNGSPTDPNAKQFKAGAMSELKGKVTISKSFDTKDWKPENAQANMTEAINAIGAENIEAVYSANDGMAGGIVKALKAAGVTDMPPITGQDAELAAVQRILAGEQYMSVYKSYPEEAESAAEMAVAKVQGRDIQFDALTRDRVDSPTTKDIPAQLVPVVALTKENIGDTVVADKIYKVSEICTARLQAACAAVNLT
ncbi:MULTISPECIES: sugar ABC transporter substrate-binding protein [Streptomyces]|jgi:D-xylose transport system substrate-binding protein|uniref:ABC transporter substrate-binding protein n=2 Tax=Streptomyces TaxID=1883 RepID=A0A514JRT5_9ACTN|nr:MULTISPECIES: substrate-binding domain-containing protein [Streptomyces]MBA8943470.1 D-xylose transport system substrate-binding protein [Streptomyces calvus]MBA8977112.1 D-xylose transport system substrate-binding protein [Streptomyces calvus]MYS31284.1 substrate-binding domain-containing protein [Streptomyces sp. SID7804]QDI70069.1 ABC transporter substrate-binding protein [Streptomyces calvus]GGP38928.1 solute-binding protein [Streptomyces calvus]